jgi:mRNA interferase MazF
MKNKKWSIWRANLDPIIGSEQGLTRPVLIISDDLINEVINTVNIIPLTSRKSGRQIYPNEVLLNPKLLDYLKNRFCYVIKSRLLIKDVFRIIMGM